MPERGTLGEEIFRIFCQRVASDELPNDVSGRESRDVCAGTASPDAAPTPRLRAMAENRDRLVAALDQTLPEPLEDDLDHFMLQLVPFYDPPAEQLPTQTRALADLLTKLEEDDEAVGALERLSTRVGYRPLRLALGVTRPALAYPRIVELTETALTTIDEGGAAGEEWDDLLRAISLELATSEASEPEDGASTLELTRQLLFTTRAEFAGDGGSRYMVVRDGRGIVVPASDDGSVPAPFVDMDGDGLADVDPLGRFVGRAGLVEVPAPFAVLGEGDVLRGTAGRALRADRTPIFAYRDVNQTLLAGVTREAPPLLDPEEPALLDMAYGLPVLLGPEGMREEVLGRGVTVRYPGYDTSSGPLFDLVWGTGALLTEEETDDVLALVDQLLEENEHELAGLIDSGLFGDAVADATPDASIPPDSELWDDLIQVVQWMADEPGLLEAVLRALADPRSRRLGTVYAEMMRFRDEVGFDPADLNRPMRDQVWTDPVDPAAPDTADNTSLFQRSISVIHDLDGVRYCNKDGARLRMRLLGLNITYPLVGGSFDECELLEIENVVDAYSQSIIGRYELEIKDGFLNVLLDVGSSLGIDPDRVLEESSGIDGLTRTPTPEALNRMIFTREGNEFLEELFDPIPSRDGVPIEERHDPILFAWERSFRFCGDELVAPDAPCAEPEEVSFYEAMSPLLEAFDSFDRRREGRFLFGRLVTALHTHWPSEGAEMTQDADPSAPFFAHHDDARSYEPILAALFGDCDWMPAGGAGGRRCDPERGGQLIKRLQEASAVLDGLEVRPGVDGIDVLTNAALSMVRPAEGLLDRAGSAVTTTNGGREIPLTRLHLMLDALSDFDAAFAGAPPERLERWRSARSVLVDQFLPIRERSGARQLENRRVYGLLRVLVPFLRDRIADHRARGDLQEWAEGLSGRMEDTLGSHVGATAFRFSEAVQTDEVAKEELAELVRYLMNEASENDAFDTTLLATADLLQVLEDDDNLVPLLPVLAEGVAPGVRDQIAGGGVVDPAELELAGSAIDTTLDLLRDIVEVDDRRTLREVLANLVSLQENGETPLETIIDVVAEVNRVEPNAGGPLRADDHRSVLGNTNEFLVDERRGLERIYDVVQARQLEE
ncbi:MAG TPA: hypothetical protein RMH85_21665 [Polyangiaceae bacterium LLY-WYZ-15_(1-7)]|nr:hypothetical protein [Sandaracinus sp.]MBJ71700.1 hypothetical protein [Sandaracinus sp.]HJL00054.1 hypothetical protein [Polyangiaceae bacterium LLY-WYZ-15_(1-7)]HJL11099.1 hypothetical protein [Polyangiaceae bacterium LLY-WYZ-15_(1-7)]HJL24625.1 hypothetical protein [Polyangiaceae bacterium LLY-WYZ-15_(1-7)]